MSEDLDLSAYEALVTEHALFGAARSRMLEELVGGKPWRVDLSAGVGTFGKDEHRIELLGTCAPDDTFLWAWANPGAQSWGLSLGLASQARLLAERPGLACFSQPKIANNWVRYRELAWVTGERAGGKAIYFAEAGDTIAVLALPAVKLDVGEIPSALLAGVLLDALPDIAPPLRPRIQRFFERLGFTVEERALSLVSVRQKTVLTVTFDQEDNIKKIDGTL